MSWNDARSRSCGNWSRLGKGGRENCGKAGSAGYPAALSGLVGTNDAVLAVAEEQSLPFAVLETTDVAEVAKRIRGPQGSKVFLTLGPKDNFESQSRVIRLVRDAIKDSSRKLKTR